MIDTATETPSTTITAHRSSGATKLLLALMLAVLAGFGWYIFQFHQQLTMLQTSLVTSQKQINQHQQTTEQLAKKIARLSLYEKNNGWIIEAESLLLLARQQVMLYKDPVQAVDLLDQTDKFLSKKSNPRIPEIRQYIANERAALLAHKRIDTEKIYFDIDSLIQELDSIPVVDLKNVSKQKVEESFIKNQSIAERVLASLHKALVNLGAYIRIQDHDIAIEALLTPGEQLYLKHNLRLMLEQAQLAVLRNQQNIYAASIQSSEKWVNKYYFINPETKAAVLQTLQTLSTKKLESTLPEINESLVALRALRAEQLQEAAP